MIIRQLVESAQGYYSEQSLRHAAPHTVLVQVTSFDIASKINASGLFCQQGEDHAQGIHPETRTREASRLEYILATIMIVHILGTVSVLHIVGIGRSVHILGASRNVHILGASRIVHS